MEGYRDNQMTEEAENTPTEYVDCPWCGEEDFDLIGLKLHLERGCEKYDETLVS